MTEKRAKKAKAAGEGAPGGSADHESNGNGEGKATVTEKRSKVKPPGDDARPARWDFSERPKGFMDFQVVHRDVDGTYRVRVFQNDRLDIELVLNDRDFDAFCEAVADTVTG